MSTYTIPRHSIEAVESMAAKDDRRWYVTGVYFSGSHMAVSDSYTLLRVKVSAECSPMFVRKADLKQAAAIAKAQGKDTVEVTYEMNAIGFNAFPPCDAAFPSNEQEVSLLNLDQLINVLTAMKKAMKDKRQRVVHVIRDSSSSRPLLFRSEDGTVEALIVPCRF